MHVRTGSMHADRRPEDVGGGSKEPITTQRAQTKILTNNRSLLNCNNLTTTGKRFFPGHFVQPLG